MGFDGGQEQNRTGNRVGGRLARQPRWGAPSLATTLQGSQPGRRSGVDTGIFSRGRPVRDAQST